MRADIARAIQAIRAAWEFDWTWTVDDLVTFSEQVGWRLTRPHYRWPELITDLEVNRPEAMLSINNLGKPGTLRPLNEISFRATDVMLDDPSIAPELDQIFDELAQRVFEVVGQRATGWGIEPT